MMFHSAIIPSKLIFSSLVLIGVMASIHLAQAKRTVNFFFLTGSQVNRREASNFSSWGWSGIRSFGYFNFRGNDAIKTRRGGCAAFGHSCFGGHGKRTDTTINPSEVEELAVGLQPPTDDAKAFVASDVPRTPAEIFNGDQLDNNDLNIGLPFRYQEPMNYVKLSPFFRKWLANSYRRGDLFGVNK